MRCMEKNDHQIESLASREQKSDPSVIYDDLDRLPEWWQDAVREFESYNLRPYQPSRFANDEIVQDVIDDLEEEYNVSIALRAKNPGYDGEWDIVVDGNTVAKTQHQRKADGYTVYDISREELEDEL